MISWNLIANEFCSVNPKNVSFWDTTLKAKKIGKFSGPAPNLACVVYDDEGFAWSGASNGSVYKWKGGSLVKAYPFHKGVVHAINFVIDD